MQSFWAVVKSFFFQFARAFYGAENHFLVLNFVKFRPVENFPYFTHMHNVFNQKLLCKLTTFRLIPFLFCEHSTNEIRENDEVLKILRENFNHQISNRNAIPFQIRQHYLYVFNFEAKEQKIPSIIVKVHHCVFARERYVRNAHTHRPTRSQTGRVGEIRI